VGLSTLCITTLIKRKRKKSNLWITINFWRPYLEGFEPIEIMFEWAYLLDCPFSYVRAGPEILYNGAGHHVPWTLSSQKQKQKVLALKKDDFESYSLEKELTCPLKLSWFDFDGDFTDHVLLGEKGNKKEKRCIACNSSFADKTKAEEKIKRCTKIQRWWSKHMSSIMRECLVVNQVPAPTSDFCTYWKALPQFNATSKLTCMNFNLPSMINGGGSML
jgi:hypothetical protein